MRRAALGGSTIKSGVFSFWAAVWQESNQRRVGVASRVTSYLNQTISIELGGMMSSPVSANQPRVNWWLHFSTSQISRPLVIRQITFFVKTNLDREWYTRLRIEKYRIVQGA